MELSLLEKNQKGDVVGYVFAFGNYTCCFIQEIGKQTLLQHRPVEVIKQFKDFLQYETLKTLHDATACNRYICELQLYMLEISAAFNT
ncbi:CLUMA_CG008174, isoform A [Clunio marinus]|uniref:CLUMA_CG008174, isoform A n=1 Tax=Clunio marinus TaxID=568069 RepID=A0A1J1I4I6_9DIPT|nr:CLUMA_CG008174, isoform A [Clunio marinus]